MSNELPISFKSFMIIDDNLIDLYIASRMITKNNFGKKVLQYSSAIEALKYLQGNQENIPLLPEVIFVDIYMPGMSGFEFMAEYDNLPANLKNHCRVFIISSSVDEEDVAKANSDTNVVAMKEKPITKEFLNELKISYSIS
ncbi:response regulator [Salegentibacter sp. JZCK2]|uniref:response regulator n=1 Tax=Salegentibacter tibetensis TaxID=2873600 RepID=UPI001CCFDF8E|nr:response regulator [Salegentibacter tibetensis]MBZ9730373.1 response regulator [Salegentibacter tibetensis]